MIGCSKDGAKKDKVSISIQSGKTDDGFVPTIRKCRNRLHFGNDEKGATFEFEVSREDFDSMETFFEWPGDREMIGGIIINE